MMIEAQIKQLGYKHPMQGPDGRWYALFRFLFTWGIICGIDEAGYERRFCYESLNECIGAYADWSLSGFVGKPEGWVAEK